MATVTIKPGQLGALLRSAVTTNRNAIRKGMKLAAHRGKADLVKASPVYTGLYKSSWHVIESGNDIILENSSPIAGIIERGARPHGINAEGVEALKRWVYLKTGLDPDYEEVGEPSAEAVEANAILWGIIHRLKEQGQPGLYIVRDALPQLQAYVNQEVNRQIEKALNKP